MRVRNYRILKVYQEDRLEDINLLTKKLNLDTDEVIAASCGVSNKPSCRTSLFSSDDVDTDRDEWKNKSPQEWNEGDTKNWLIWVSEKYGFAYGRVPCELVIPGRELLTLKRSDLIELDSGFGKKLYDLLQQRSCKTSIFRSDDVDTNEDDWKSKPVKEWKKIDTKEWLISESKKLGIAYGALPCELGISGQELIGMKRRDFIRLAPTFGETLYDLLREHGVRNQQQARKHKDGLKSSKKQLGFGRPRVRKPKPNKKSERVWQFVISLLHDPQCCPALIRWENYEERTIRFIDSQAIGKLWGKKKNNERMDYRKFSRALRHYRHRGTFVAVKGMRLVYKFGKNIPGLETDDPNFTIAKRKTSDQILKD